MGESGREKKVGQARSTKRCPECFTELPSDIKRCPSCKQKLGRGNEYGLAKKPVNWANVVMCILAWAGFVVYIWWAFIK